MFTGKIILRREYFGGILIDTAKNEMKLLDEGEYQWQRKLLSSEQNRRKVLIYDASEKGYDLPKTYLASPQYIFMELTKRCNGYCRYCYMHASASKADPGDEITIEEIERLILEFSSHAGGQIRLTGGEPTIRPDILDIIGIATSEGLNVSINTNGIIPPKELDNIVESGVRDFRISIDGPEEVNDALRGKGSFRAALRTVKRLREHKKSGQKLKVTLNVVLSRSNQLYIEDIIELAVRYDAMISFGLLRLAGRAKREEMLTPEEVARASYRVCKTRKKYGIDSSSARINYDVFHTHHLDEKVASKKHFLPYPFDNSRCPTGTTGMSIDSQGRTGGCGYLFYTDDRWKGEKIQGKSLMDIWHNSPILTALRKIDRKECAACQFYKTACSGGCPMMAYVVNGDLNAPDPYCIRATYKEMSAGNL